MVDGGQVGRVLKGQLHVDGSGLEWAHSTRAYMGLRWVLDERASEQYIEAIVASSSDYGGEARCTYETE
jgi:hypothetical protein